MRGGAGGEASERDDICVLGVFSCRPRRFEHSKRMSSQPKGSESKGSGGGDLNRVCARDGCEKDGSKLCGGCRKVCHSTELRRISLSLMHAHGLSTCKLEKR